MIRVQIPLATEFFSAVLRKFKNKLKRGQGGPVFKKMKLSWNRVHFGSVPPDLFNIDEANSKIRRMNFRQKIRIDSFAIFQPTVVDLECGDHSGQKQERIEKKFFFYGRRQK